MHRPREDLSSENGFLHACKDGNFTFQFLEVINIIVDRELTLKKNSSQIGTWKGRRHLQLCP